MLLAPSLGLPGTATPSASLRAVLLSRLGTSAGAAARRPMDATGAGPGVRSVGGPVARAGTEGLRKFRKQVGQL